MQDFFNVSILFLTAKFCHISMEFFYNILKNCYAWRSESEKNYNSSFRLIVQSNDPYSGQILLGNFVIELFK